MRKFGTIALMAVLGLVASATPAETQYADEAMTGIKIGEPAPDFTLKDHTGAEHTLSKILEKGPVVLYFNRSADW